MARGANVLIVDDDPSIRQTIEVIVNSVGMRTLTASSGEEALELCNRQSVDLVLPRCPAAGHQWSASAGAAS
jgi:CheY-like chemotaxis protein